MIEDDTLTALQSAIGRVVEEVRIIPKFITVEILGKLIRTSVVNSLYVKHYDGADV